MGEASSFCGSALPLTPPPLFLIYSVLPVIGADGFIEIFTLWKLGWHCEFVFRLLPVSRPFAPARHTQTCFPPLHHFFSLFSCSLAPFFCFCFYLIRFIGRNIFEIIFFTIGSTRKRNIKNLHQYFVGKKHKMLLNRIN